MAGCIARAIRVAQALRDRAATEPDARIALITHAAFSAKLVKTLTSQLPGDDAYYHFRNTAISRIDFDDSGVLHIRYLNRIDHLPPQMIT